MKFCQYIHKNQNLIHLNLRETGMSELCLMELLKNGIAKSKSLLAVHLCGNPGLTYDFMDLAHKTLKMQTTDNDKKEFFNKQLLKLTPPITVTEAT